MTNKKFLLSISSMALMLSSCNLINPVIELTSSSINKDSEIHELFIEEEGKTLYSQFDLLNISGLIVESNDNSTYRRIKDYSLTWIDTKTTAYQDELLDKDPGDYQIEISKAGYSSAYLTITIEESENYVQSIKVDSSPTKTTYRTSQTFNSEGLIVKLNTSYTNADGLQKNTSTSIYNYTLTINNKDALTYTFERAGSLTVLVSYTARDLKVLTATFSITVLDNVYQPEEVVDNITMDTDDDTVTINITNSNKENTDKGYYSPDEVDTSFNIYQYGFKNAYNWHYTPTTGKVPLLFVPVVIPGYESQATEANRNLIKKCAFGKSSDLNFESLHSYYYKASYGQLDFTGTITDYFYLKDYNSLKYGDTSKYNDETIDDIAKDALKWACLQGLDPTEYDLDKDGYIDAMWLIYTKPAIASTSSSNGNIWWAYSTSAPNENNEKPDISSPIVNNYGWASIDFLNDNFINNGFSYSNSSGDAHVMIHETGHMLGLSDYYSYSYSGYAPLGTFDIMDNNAGDHNPYSKLMLGWIKPYIVYGNATITLKTSQFKNQVIVIGYDDKTYSKNSDGKVIFNMFDEYLIVDFYTNQNLNRQGYDCYNIKNINSRGGRIYHVDARSGYYSRGVYGLSCQMFSNPDDILTSSSNMLIKPITNSEAGNNCESKLFGLNSSYDSYDEIRWISADFRTLSTTNTASASSLFTGLTSSFSLSSYRSQFPKQTTFNNGSEFNYHINFRYLNL